MDRVTEVSRKNGVATVKFLSGETVRVPSALYLERRVRAGDFMDPEAYRLFAAQRGYPHALESAMKFLALRERSEQEITSRLRRSCYADSAIQKVLDTLKAHHLVSDSRFAEEWVASRSKKYGKRRIAQELRMKGISSPEAQQALDEWPEEEEYRRALEHGLKLNRKFQGDRQKITQALIRRGYSFSIARKAAEEAAKT
ncbi:MAG: regulatory protein RecX [Clostridia bacterium]|nr:regulatory protein RecX [Clostridia bacterium]